MAEIAAHLPIETEHLILRPFTEDELPALAALHADPNLMRWIPRGSISVVERLPGKSCRPVVRKDPAMTEMVKSTAEQWLAKQNDVEATGSEVTLDNIDDVE